MQGALRIDVRVKLLFLVVFTIACLHARTIAGMAACAAVAVGASLAARCTFRDVLKALAALAVVLVFTVVMQVLYYQQGTVLFRIGPVAITEQALWQAGCMVVSLACMMAVSVAFMRTTTTEELMGAFSWLLSPLRRLGVNVDALMLALTVTFRFIPVLVSDFRTLKAAQQARSGAFDGPVRQRVAAYSRLFAPLVRGSLRRADTLADALVSRCFGQK